MNNFSDKIVLIDYYSGADGLILRIDCTTLDQLKYFKTIFEHLVKSVEYKINLVGLKDITSLNISEFLLQTLPGEKKTIKRLNIYETQNVRITWQMTSYEWEKISQLIQALIDKNASGHQYLNENNDDAVIEFTYRERPN